MLKKILNGENNCFFEPKTKCLICGMLLGDCIVKDEKGKRNLGYHKYQIPYVKISPEEVNLLPESLCTSKECLKKAAEMEAA